MLHLHANLLFPFEQVQADSTAELNLSCFSNFQCIHSILNKKQVFFRPAPVSYKRGYYFENQGLVLLKFMFLICGTLLYCLLSNVSCPVEAFTRGQTGRDGPRWGKHYRHAYETLTPTIKSKVSNFVKNMRMALQQMAQKNKGVSSIQCVILPFCNL